jgi:hypothetical protein
MWNKHLFDEIRLLAERTIRCLPTVNQLLCHVGRWRLSKDLSGFSPRKKNVARGCRKICQALFRIKNVARGCRKICQALFRIKNVARGWRKICQAFYRVKICRAWLTKDLSGYFPRKNVARATRNVQNFDKPKLWHKITRERLRSTSSSIWLFIRRCHGSPEHDGLHLDVEVGRLRLLRRQHLDRPLQVQGERVQPQRRQRVDVELGAIGLKSYFKGCPVCDKDETITGATTYRHWLINMNFSSF